MLRLSSVAPFPRPLLHLGILCFLYNAYAVANQSYNSLTMQDVIIDEPIEPSCTVLAPENGYNYAQLQAKLFQNSTTTTLPPLSQTWQVTCSAPINALFIAVEADIQANSLSETDPTYFSLGAVNGQGRLGYFQVSLDDATVDGHAVKLYQTSDQRTLSSTQSKLQLKPSVFYGWTQDGQTPAKGQLYSVKVTVSPTLYSLQETHGPLVEGADLNGELVLTFPFSI